MKIDVAIGNADFARRNRYYVVIERTRKNSEDGHIDPRLGLKVQYPDPETERLLYIVNKKGIQKRQGLWDHFEKEGWTIKVLKRQAAMTRKYDKIVKG